MSGLTRKFHITTTIITIVFSLNHMYFDNDVLAFIFRFVPKKNKMKLRIVNNEWRNVFDDNNKHLFSSRVYPVHLPIASDRDRVFQHKKAKKLGFRHDSVGHGKFRHLTLWHPTGACCLRMSIASGNVSVSIQHVAALNRSYVKKKKKKPVYYEPEEAEYGAPECIKCGFRTWRDYCPLCGRPTL